VDLVLFWVTAVISVGAAVAMILARNAVHSALWLILNLFTLAVLFLVLGSPFLFVVQIIVYAGAIMVLFLFVIMLLGVDQAVSLRETIRGQRWLAVALGVGLIAEVFFAVRLGVGLSAGELPDLAVMNEGGNIRALARVLFGPYFFPFELTSVLLIVAAIGAMLHGRRRIGGPPASAHTPAAVDAATPARSPSARSRGAPGGYAPPATDVPPAGGQPAHEGSGIT
jgi:NADH-quinone oxidoreductase subunit J